MIKSHYSRLDIENALRSLGLKKSKVVFSHSNIAYFGVPAGGADFNNLENTILEPILDCLGPEGTYVVPTFSYTFQVGQVFEPELTPSVCGLLTEMVRCRPNACRSEDPIFSVAAVGARAKELTGNVSCECFGKDSFWDRFYHADGVILNINFGVPVTFFHYVEKSLNVPYRYDKVFICTIRKNGADHRKEAVYFCRDLTNPLTAPDWMGIHELAVSRGLAKTASVGRGYITLIKVRPLYDLIAETLKVEPFFLTKSRVLRTIPEIGTTRKNFQISFRDNEVLTNEKIEVLKSLPRDFISDGYDLALRVLESKIPMKYHEYPTGTKYGTWYVPEKWTCRSAYIESPNGERMITYEDDLYNLATYSKSFTGMLTREELLDHMLAASQRPDIKPIKFMYYDGGWGFCCIDKLKSGLGEGRYKVAIETEFSYGQLKVAEAFAAGSKRDCVIVCTHLSDRLRPYDGILNTSLGINAFKGLKKITNLKYSYYFLILPAHFVIGMYLDRDFKDSQFLKKIYFLNFSDSRKSIATEEFDFNRISDSFPLNSVGEGFKFVLPEKHVPCFNIALPSDLSEKDFGGKKYSGVLDSIVKVITE